MKARTRNDETWTMRDGRTIAIKDMTEEHAKNCLRLICRRRRLAARQKAAYRYEGGSDDARDWLDGPDEGDGPDWDEGCRD